MSVKVKGFTLVELLATVAVMAVIFAIAVPNLGGFLSSSRVDSVKNKLVSAIGYARSEAISRGSAVAICRKQADPNNTCVGTSMAAGVADWSDGWLVFLDEDDDQTLDADELIRVYGGIDSQSGVSFSRGDVFVYSGQGLLDTASTGDEVFIITDSGDASVGAGLSVRLTGRVRQCANWVVSAATCND